MIVCLFLQSGTLIFYMAAALRIVLSKRNGKLGEAQA
jgi:hypothetical protein